MIHANREETELDRWRRLRSKGVSWPIEGPLDWSEASAISSPKLPPRAEGKLPRKQGRRRRKPHDVGGGTEPGGCSGPMGDTQVSG
jgi:hypothetical protein